jgi:hypothetical protein
MDFEHAKRVGIEAIYRGARLLRDRFGRISQINQKGAFDLITEADIESEKRFPTMPFWPKKAAPTKEPQNING